MATCAITMPAWVVSARFSLYHALRLFGTNNIDTLDHAHAVSNHQQGPEKLSKLKLWLREPLIHFLLMGGLLFFGYGFFNEPESDPNQIVVSRGDIDSLKARWTKQRGRLPTDGELKLMVDQTVRDRILAAEARSLGLDKNDFIVQRRLSQKMDFLFTDLIRIQEPDDKTLQAYLDKHIESFQKPPRVSFFQIYFNPEKRKNALSDASALLDRLNQGESVDLEVAGDRFLLPSHFRENSPSDVERTFGKIFTQTLFSHLTEGWSEPIVSGFGIHLVLIRSFYIPATPTLDEVRSRVQSEWMEAKVKEKNLEFYSELKNRYTIILPDGAGD